MITSVDALTVINKVIRNRSSQLALDSSRSLAQAFVDASRDEFAAPIDAPLVINGLNGGGSGEGESPATSADAAATSWTLVANSEMYEPGSWRHDR